MVPETIEFDIDDRVGTITIDRPPVNAVSTTQYQNYTEFLREVGERDDLQVLVFKTAGEDGYLAGHDINEFVDLGPEQARSLTADAQSFFKAVDEFPWPTIAAIDGYAHGTGLAFVTVTDLRYATTDAVFSLPEIDRGVLGGYKFIQRHLPEGRARELLYTARELDATTAREEGLLQGCYSTREELFAGVAEIATTIAAKDETAVSFAKELVGETVDMPVHEGYETECRYTARLRNHESAHEASDSFFDS